MPITHFTCRLLHAGIGDQLSQLQTLYGLGRHYGLTYVHTPLANRWCPGLDINRFLGLAHGERSLGEVGPATFVDLPYSLLIDRFRRRAPLPEPEVSGVVARGAARLFRFVASPEIYSFKPEFPAGTPPERLDLAAKFRAAHAAAPSLSPFRTSRRKVAIHIRRGDCTWFRNGSTTLLPFLGRVASSSSPDVNLRRALPLAFYRTALERLSAEFGAENLEVRLYSDGVGWPLIGPLRGKELTRHLLAGALGLCGIRPRFAPAVNAFTWLVQRRLPALRRELKTFARGHPGAVLREGRSAALTRETICAFATADVIVVARAGAFPDLGLGLNPNQVRMTPATFTPAVPADASSEPHEYTAPALPLTARLRG